jgi:hypothetical protein
MASVRPQLHTIRTTTTHRFKLTFRFLPYFFVGIAFFIKTVRISLFRRGGEV